MNVEELPVVRLALRDHFTKIQARSSYHFERDVVNPIDLVGVSSPVAFEYMCSGCRFTLPAARFVGIDLDDGHVVDVDISPHLEHLTLDEAIKLLVTLGETFARSGWRRVSAEYASWDLLRKKYAAPETDDDFDAEIESWAYEGDEIYITLERLWRQGELRFEPDGVTEDLFIITVSIESGADDADEA